MTLSIKFMSRPADTIFSLSFLHPRYWLTWLGLGLLLVLAYTPVSFRHKIGKAIGNQIYRRNSKRRKIVDTNLALCFPDKTDQQRKVLCQQHLQWYGCALVEYGFYFFSSKARLYRTMQIEGKEHIDAALQAGSPVMFLLGHSVFLDFVPAMLGQFYQTYGSYKPFSNPIINWLVARNRCKHVDFVVAREEGMMRLVRELKGEQCLIFLPDEDHGAEHSHFAPFFGVDKATLDTPARIARLAKAKCFPVMAFFNQQTGKYTIQVGEALSNYPSKNAESNAATMNQGFEELIQYDPTQYMWLMKLFKTQPNTDKKRY